MPPIILCDGCWASGLRLFAFQNGKTGRCFCRRHNRAGVGFCLDHIAWSGSYRDSTWTGHFGHRIRLGQILAASVQTGRPLSHFDHQVKCIGEAQARFQRTVR